MAYGREDSIARGTLAADEATVQIARPGMNAVVCHLVSTVDFQGTIKFEVSMDASTSWFNIQSHRFTYSGATWQPNKAMSHLNGAATTVVNHMFVVPVIGWHKCRIRVDTYTSGSISCVLTATEAVPDFNMYA